MEKNKEVILKAEHVKTYFPIRGMFGRVIGNVKAVDDISLELYRGETYGLVGETGCGKSTLGRTLIRLLEATEGSVYVENTDITKLRSKDLLKMRQRMQMVFQDPYTSLDGRMRVGDILMETLAIQNIAEPHLRMDIVLKILNQVGLRVEHYYRFPHEMSGGQRQRVGLARALLLHPDLIICDEPVSALDVSVRSQILNLLQDLQESEDLTYLFISHDMSVVRYTSDRVGVMYRGKLVELAPTAQLYTNPQHPYTKALLSAIPIPDPIAERSRKRADFDELSFERGGVLTEIAPGHFVLRKEDF